MYPEYAPLIEPIVLTCHKTVDNVPRLIRPRHVVQGLSNVQEHHVDSEIKTTIQFTLGIYEKVKQERKTKSP